MLAPTKLLGPWLISKLFHSDHGWDNFISPELKLCLSWWWSFKISPNLYWHLGDPALAMVKVGQIEQLVNELFLPWTSTRSIIGIASSKRRLKHVNMQAAIPEYAGRIQTTLKMWQDSYASCRKMWNALDDVDVLDHLTSFMWPQ